MARHLFKKYGIFDSTNVFKLHNFIMKGKIRYESEFLTLIEDLVKLIIKSAIISFLSEYFAKKHQLLFVLGVFLGIQILNILM